MTTEHEREKLGQIYAEAVKVYERKTKPPTLSNPHMQYIKRIAERQEESKGVLAVTVTLLFKKVITPGQDIRQHQANLPGGFSGRRLDTRTVTPFLKAQRFPAMSESGWLTRSLEQNHAYTLNYPGSITPAALKTAFLGLVDAVHKGEMDAHDALLLLLKELIEFRDRSTNLILFRPVNLTISQVIEKLIRHRDLQSQGVSRLPVLAVHAVMSILGKEADRYEGYSVLPLEPHTSPDSKTNLIGDINIVDGNGAMFEGYEVKHGLPVTEAMIETAVEKIRTTPVERYYILTTYQQGDYSAFNNTIRQIGESHGCQMIVNGVDPTVSYFLRIIGSTRQFVDAYVSHLESDPAINFQIKETWNNLVAE